MLIEKKWPFSRPHETNSGGGDGGFLYDRQWIIVDGDHVPVNQKRTPGLPRIQPTIDLVCKKMIIRFDSDEDWCEIPLNLTNGIVWNGKNGQTG